MKKIAIATAAALVALSGSAFAETAISDVAAQIAEQAQQQRSSVDPVVTNSIGAGQPVVNDATGTHNEGNPFYTPSNQR